MKVRIKTVKKAEFDVEVDPLEDIRASNFRDPFILG